MLSTSTTCPHLRAMRQRRDQRVELTHLVNAASAIMVPPDDEAGAASAVPPAAAAAARDMHQCVHCDFRGLRSTAAATAVGAVGARARARELQRHQIAEGHFLAVSPARGALWCARCGDYVYDALFEEAWKRRRRKREVGEPFERGDTLEELEESAYDAATGAVIVAAAAATPCLKAEEESEAEELLLLSSGGVANSNPLDHAVPTPRK